METVVGVKMSMSWCRQVVVVVVFLILPRIHIRSYFLRLPMSYCLTILQIRDKQYPAFSLKKKILTAFICVWHCGVFVGRGDVLWLPVGWLEIGSWLLSVHPRLITSNSCLITINSATNGPGVHFQPCPRVLSHFLFQGCCQKCQNIGRLVCHQMEATLKGTAYKNVIRTLVNKIMAKS